MRRHVCRVCWSIISGKRTGLARSFGTGLVGWSIISSDRSTRRRGTRVLAAPMAHLPMWCSWRKPTRFLLAGRESAFESPGCEFHVWLLSMHVWTLFACIYSALSYLTLLCRCHANLLRDSLDRRAYMYRHTVHICPKVYLVDVAVEV